MTQQDYATLPLARICDPGTFDVHPFLKNVSPNNNLYQSIEISGILSPPIVIEAGNGNYDVICGRQRLLCWKLLGKIHCHCRILSKQSSLEEILTFVIEDQFSNGQLKNIEQACFVELCRKHLPEEHRFKSFIGQLLPGRITKGIRFLQPLTRLDAGFQYKIYSGSISEKIIADLLNFKKEDRHQFVDLSEALQLGTNNQQKLIQQIDDIINREDISLFQFINQKPIQQILRDDQLDNVRKTSALFALIHNLHQPRLSSAQDEFVKKLKDLGLPKNCRLSPSQSFESKKVTLAVQFNNYESFEEKWNRIREFLEE